jgi:pyruvate dehydrogenase E2 component (dihydrolipoamide acetyltransferase)
MATKILLPQGGQDLEEATVLGWLKQEGDSVVKGEVLCEIETAKAVFEVEAPEDGVLIKIIVPGGQTAPVLSVIGYLGQPGEQVEVPEPLTPVAAATSTSPITELDESKSFNEKEPPPSIDLATDRLKISGRARRRAKERQIDPVLVRGSGHGGRVVEKDVLIFTGTVGQESLSLRPPKPVVYPNLAGKQVPLTKMRRVIARRLQESKQQVPHFYVTVSVDMGEALKVRTDFNRSLNRHDKRKVSVNDLIIRATALSLEEYYQMNCHFREDHLLYLDDINIGVAVSLPNGLVVPVLEHTDRLSLGEIGEQTKALISGVKSGKQASLAPGSFTISNMGMMEIENFVAIINPPECGILAVGSTQKKIVVSEAGDLCIRQMMKMTLSADHRAVDGILASNFINKIKYHLQNPRTLL